GCHTRGAVVKSRLWGMGRARQGQGSHGLLYVGGRLTSVKRTEISKALLHAMLKDLGIEKGDFWL
ncbi:MAG: hypothetical protein OXN89_00880, partial [Bryobacterales bacterium]|nr:hypothetical protein [Bryobacterales bacterium]